MREAGGPRPLLSGLRLVAWTALIALISFVSTLTYFAFSRARSEGRLFLALVVVGLLYLVLRRPRQGVLRSERIPEVRFGAFLGLVIGALCAFVSLLARR